MDLSLLTTKLKKIDKKNNLRFYLFGSAKDKKSPNDIDLLIVYGNKYSMCEMIDIRKEVKLVIKSMHSLDSDIILFSESEAKGNSFIKNERCILL